jgi:hypothetical protein
MPPKMKMDKKTPKPGEKGGAPGTGGVAWKPGMGMSITNPSKPKKKRMGIGGGNGKPFWY